jgi:hypothetical protein
VVLSLSNGFYILWITTLNLDAFKNGRGSLRRWKNMNDDDLLRDLLSYSGQIESDSKEERLSGTFVEEPMSQS